MSRSFAKFVLALGFVYGGLAHAGICEKLLTPTELGNSASANQYCITHTDTKVETSSAAGYLTNPSAACNLPHLSLPGLPDFGAHLSLNMCSIVQNITGSVVNQVNTAAQAAANAAISKVSQSTPGMNAYGQINVQGANAVNNAYNQSAGKTVQNAGNSAVNHLLSP